MSNSLSTALVNNSVEPSCANASYIVINRFSTLVLLAGFVVQAIMSSVNNTCNIFDHRKFRFCRCELVPI